MTTPRKSASSRRNIAKAQMSRIRRREPRQAGRVRPLRVRVRTV